MSIKNEMDRVKRRASRISKIRVNAIETICSLSSMPYAYRLDCIGQIINGEIPHLVVHKAIIDESNFKKGVEEGTRDGGRWRWRVPRGVGRRSARR